MSRISVNNSTQQLAGMFYVQATLEAGDVEQAEQRIIEEISRLQRDGPTADELELAIIKAESEHAFAYETSDGVASAYGLARMTATLEDEIVSAFPSVVNDAGESDREGVELTARVDLGWISFGGSYTHLDADDPDGTEEVRRPKHQASFDVSGRFGPR